MKHLLLLFLTTAAIFSQTASITINKHPNIGGIQIFPEASVTNDPTTTCSKYPQLSTFCSTEPSCAANGNYFRCLRNGKPSTVFKCSAAKPYCIGTLGAAYCSKDPDVDCRAETHQCLGVGAYPEIGNCRAYYKCDLNAAGDQLVARRFSCPDGETFNPAFSGCRRGVCVYARCPKNLRTSWLTLNYYGYDRNRMGVLCSSGTAILLYVCPNNMQINRLNTEETGCKFVCDAIKKRAPDLFDNTKYWECFRRLPVFRSCSVGEVFDADALVCTEPSTFIPGG